MQRERDEEFYTKSNAAKPFSAFYNGDTPRA